MAKRTLITLPLFLHAGNKWPIGIVTYIFGAGIYLLTNHNLLFPPQLLPMTWLDQAVPMIPATVWIYLSEYPMFLVAYYLMRDHENANRYLYSITALACISAVIFELWPTTYPRELFPLPAEGMDAATRFLFTVLRESDTPANCCPSLHVSGVYLSAFVFLDEQRKKFWGFFIWGTLISFSTLTTKQHYVIDVATGFLLAVLLYWFFHRWVTYRRVLPEKPLQANR